LRSRISVLLLLGFSMIIPILLYFWIDQLELVNSVYSSKLLLFMIALVSLLAFIVSLVICIVGQRMRNIKIIFIALTYVSLLGMLLLHGLSLLDYSYATLHKSYVFAQLALIFASIWLWFSSLSADHRLVRWFAERQKYMLPFWWIVLSILSLFMWIYDQSIVHIFMYSEFGKRLITLSIIILNTWTVYRHLITYMASRFSFQLAVVYSTGWINTAQIVLITTSSHNVGWWAYHVLLFMAVLVMSIGIFREYLNTGSISASFKRLFRADPNNWINTYLTPSVKELIIATETKDEYTAGHNYRVTIYALMLGEELGLSSAQLKSIAQGGLIHDVGKIHVPDYVLNKTGKLTPVERKIIEQHPVNGYNMCKQLGFMLEELAIIRSHHEKWDGSGYPDHLAGEGIPLVARVVAVADVYDALTSSRSYRKAMSHTKAMNILESESGTHFDPRCIEAWINLVEQRMDIFEQILTNGQNMKLFIKKWS